MYHRNINTLPELNKEIVYIDELTEEERVGIVIATEQLSGVNAIMVYVASPYKKENIHEENGIAYRDIFIFDDIPNENDGMYRDAIMGNYGRIIGEEN